MCSNFYILFESRTRIRALIYATLHYPSGKSDSKQKPGYRGFSNFGPHTALMTALGFLLHVLRYHHKQNLK